MDEIIAFKNKRMKITDSQMKELLQKQIKLIDHVKNKRNQHGTDDEMKIKELTAKVTSMTENLQSAKQTLEYKNNDLSKHLDYITELEAEKNKFFEENQLLEQQRNKFRACKSNLKDQELLDLGRKKYSLYKDLTRIRWDYESLKENVKGYVSNKRDYIHYFCYENKSIKDVNNFLWKEVQQSTGCTENVDPQNKKIVFKTHSYKK